MNKLARLPTIDRRADAEAATSDVPRLRTRYYAFLSYSHKDRELADWLHRELERFRVPSSLAGKLTANGVVPRRLTPVFRDQHDLSAGDDLAVEIEAALAASQFLVVLCSPTAAKSRWTNLEIESFKRTRPEGCVLAAVVAGEPFASEIRGREAEECFPPALRYKYDRRGRRTAKRAEPLAADFREGGEGKRLAFLKLVAGMLGVGLDELVQRETTRRHRQLAYVAAASLAGMAVTSTLAVTAIQARDAAREQRRQAEGLIGFMLGDLKDKLEPIGKLDALDGVGARVLAYYKKQGTADLSDSGLLQRSRALRLMGEVANSRGDLDTADALYREAAASTAEAIRRNPDDPQRLYEHAQNEFDIGEIATRKGQLAGAERAFREYQRLAERMVALEPDNMKWRMEAEDAEGNLAAILSEQRRFSESALLWGQAIRTIDALATADPANGDYQKSLLESLAWYADAEFSAGHLANAAALRERQISLLSQLEAKTGDVNYLQKLIPAERTLGNIYAAQGQMRPAIEHAQAAVTYADKLTPVEPDNKRWLEYSTKAKLNLGALFLLSGQFAEAAKAGDSGCAATNQLLRIDPKIPQWRAALRDCQLLRAQLAIAAGSNSAALESASRAVAIAKSVTTTDTVADRYDLAKSYMVLGDARAVQGDAAGAQIAWQTAIGVIPPGMTERLIETSERAEILQRLGRNAQAQQLRSRLAALGCHYPTFSPPQRRIT